MHVNGTYEFTAQARSTVLNAHADGATVVIRTLSAADALALSQAINRDVDAVRSAQERLDSQNRIARLNELARRMVASAVYERETTGTTKRYRIEALTEEALKAAGEYFVLLHGEGYGARVGAVEHDEREIFPWQCDAFRDASCG